jgi:hypothetical protein
MLSLLAVAAAVADVAVAAAAAADTDTKARSLVLVKIQSLPKLPHLYRQSRTKKQACRHLRLSWCYPLWVHA